MVVGKQFDPCPPPLLFSMQDSCSTGDKDKSHVDGFALPANLSTSVDSKASECEGMHSPSLPSAPSALSASSPVVFTSKWTR